MSGWPAAALLLLAAPVVLAYLWRVPLRRRTVPSALPFRGLPTARPHRRRRPEEWLSLVLVLAALGIAAAALALRPRVDRHVVVVIDDSGSMAAGDRWPTAMLALDRWLEGAHDASVTLIATSPPRVLRARSGDVSSVREAAAHLSPLGSGDDPTMWVRAACADDGAELLVLSDQWSGAGWGCDERSAPALGAGSGGPAITELAVQRADALGGAELELGVVAPAAAEVTVGLAVDGIDAGEVVVAVSAGVGRERLQRPLPAGGVLTATLGGWRTSVDLPAPRLVRTVLVTEAPDGYTALGLAAHPGVALQVVSPDEGSTEPAELLIVEAAPKAALPFAPVRVSLGVDPAVVGLPAATRVGRPGDLSAAADPLWWAVDLDGVWIERAWALAETPGAEPLLASSRGVLAQRVTTSSGTWVTVGLSPADTDWPLRVGFVHFLANLVDEARSDSGSAVARATTAAEVLAPPRAEGDPLPARSVGWRQAGSVAGGLLLLEALLGLRRRRT